MSIATMYLQILCTNWPAFGKHYVMLKKDQVMGGACARVKFHDSGNIHKLTSAVAGLRYATS